METKKKDSRLEKNEENKEEHKFTLKGFVVASHALGSKKTKKKKSQEKPIRGPLVASNLVL